MDEYLIGAGAILTAGNKASISSASLHAKLTPYLARCVRAALFDFESPSVDDVSRVVAVASGWNARCFARAFSTPLLARRECGLADVVIALARAVDTTEVHLFTRWFPDGALLEATGSAGVRIVSNAVESIAAASLVSGQTVRRWSGSLRAA